MPFNLLQAPFFKSLVISYYLSFSTDDYIILCTYEFILNISVTKKNSCRLLYTHWSDVLSNLFRIMLASLSGYPNPYQLAILQPAQPTTDTVILSCSDSLAVDGEIAWYCGGVLCLQCRRETEALDQAVVKMGPWSLSA